MTRPEKKLLQTFERSVSGINGHAVALTLFETGEEIIIVATSKETAVRSADLIGIGVVDRDRVPSVTVMPRCAALDELKGD
jgi:hypothetical protein